jgi:pimeloyl-[acyl-carrier protein] methyl ester esterase
MDRQTLLRPVLIHGWGFTKEVFESFKGIKLELPFHGNSRLNYSSMETLIDDIALSLPGKHDIVGWSMGGSIALLLAYRYPSKVRRLFLIGTTPFFGGAWHRKNIRAFLSMLRREGMKGVERFRLMAYGESFKGHIELEGALRMLRDYIALDIRHLLPFVRGEKFIIHGSEDNITPVHEAIKLYNLLGNAKLFILPGGHLPVRHEEDIVSKVLKSC